MNLDQVACDIRTKIKEELYLNEPLSKHTTWKIGGPADLMVFPTSVESLLLIYKYAKQNQLPITVIGNGSNILVKDKGIRGIVIKLTKLNAISINGNSIIAQGGALLPKVVRKALENGLVGLEFGAGIPASVGGATIMNAGTYQGQMADYVQEVKVLSKAGDIISLGKEYLNFSYRSSSLKGKELVVIETTFCCQVGSVKEAKNQIAAALEKRKASQPLNFPSAGSVFKNPPGDSAGRLIEQSGIKGLRQGDAQISEKHANFIINLGSATADDVIFLIDKAQKLVAEKFRVSLEPEVLLLGE